MTSEIGGARSELIDRLVEHAASNGLTDTSLRDLAAAVGTSHRMLNYHFGSRAGVVAAVVERIESQQGDALAEIAAEATSTTEIIERQWAQLSDPALAPFIRYPVSRPWIFVPGSALASLVFLLPLHPH